MVDNTNPTNQFHPYQPSTAVPHTEKPTGGLGDILNRVGLNNQSVTNARGWAQKNPSKVLGGLAALAIGLGMMRGRRMR